MTEASDSAGPRGDPGRTFFDDDVALGLLFDRVEQEQYDLNRRAAARAAALADALAYARQCASIYALVGDAHAAETAERSAILEAAVRLRVSEPAVRAMANSADQARRRLPLLWACAREGFASMAHIESAVAMLPRFDDADASPETCDAFDTAIAPMAMTTSAASFRARVVSVARRLAPAPESALHARAFADRRVTIQNVGDGMSYLAAFIATVDAVVIKRRLAATAKHAQKAEGGRHAGSTRDQTRADLLVAWMRGTGTPTAVKTKVFVTIPLDRLDPVARTSVRMDAAPRRGTDLSREPQMLGEGPIDDATAVRLLLEAGNFTRVITDPITGVVLDMDRRSRVATSAQREWLILTHGTCTRDGCRRSAVGAEIDHWREFSGRERGPTDIENLHPFCEPDHRVKGTTRFGYRRRRDGSVQLVSPTGFTTHAEPWPDLDFTRPDPRSTTMIDALRMRRNVEGDEPPF